jgi:hypothetical protein
MSPDGPPSTAQLVPAVPGAPNRPTAIDTVSTDLAGDC